MSIKERRLAKEAWALKKIKIDAARESRGIALFCLQAGLFNLSSGEAIPAMPVQVVNHDNVHRENDHSQSADMLALVARLVKNEEVKRTPRAAKSVQKEWDHHWNIRTWLKETVREYDDVAADAIRMNETVHFGRLHPCVMKNSQKMNP